jgi:hypothetical protein
VIFKLSAFSKNLRKEISTKAKYYFLDNGIRNSIILQFNDFNSRNDFGALFENFIIMEKIKKNSYENFYGQHYFWRTYDGSEIDLIESFDNSLKAYECKADKKKAILPKEWKKNYPDSSFDVISVENYLSFITNK